jgi:ribose transport system substrate-binding protein
MTSHFYDPSDKQNPLASSSLTIGFGEIGTILANWATVVTDGKANVLLIVSDEVPPTKPLVSGFKSELAAHCPNCKIVQEVNVGVTEWGTKIQPSVQSAVQAHPEINVVIPIYDSMSQFVVPALRLTGKTGVVKVGTFNGTPFVLDYIQQGSVDMDIGESLDWIAYATIDGHVRDLCGLKSPAALNVPFYIFDKSNAKDAGVPAGYDKGYGDAYISGFHKLWKLQ